MALFEKAVDGKNEKTKLEIFKSTCESLLNKRREQNEISEEVFQFKIDTIRNNFTADQLSSDPEFDAQIYAYAGINRESVVEREKLTLDMTKYNHLSMQLNEKYEEQLFRDGEDYIDNKKPEYTIGAFLSKFPHEILEHYSGHGIRNTADPLAAFISVLDNNLFIGESGPIVPGKVHCSAYTHGGMLILSHKNRSLMQEGTNGVQVRIDDKYWVGTKIDPGVAFIVNLPFDCLVEELKQLFPNKKILHAYELIDYIREEESE